MGGANRVDELGKAHGAKNAPHCGKLTAHPETWDAFVCVNFLWFPGSKGIQSSWDFRRIDKIKC